MIAIIATAIACFVVGGILSYVLFRYVLKSKYDSILKDAETEAEVIKKNKLLEVKEKFLNKKADLEKEVALRNQKIQQAENKLKQREMVLSQRQEEIQRKKLEAEAVKENLEAQLVIVDKKKEELDKLQHQEIEKLETISGLSADEAKERLVESLKEEAKTQAQSFINDIMDDAKLTASKEAKRIVIQSIQRVATETAIENSVTVFHIESDEIKGRIIGREGRNIRALETLTGIDLIIDDTPEAVILSGFDPIRREIARLALEKLIARARQALENNGITNELLDELRQIAIHYARKGDLLYPHLKVQYGISGPSAVMWTVDDEIRDELNALAKQKDQKETDAWKQRLNAVLNRMEEMIYKESNILFPNCALNFSEEEWYHIYRDAKDYAECFGIRGDSWGAAEAHLTDTASTADTMSAEHAFTGSETRIHLPGGSLTLSQLTAMLNTIPLEISFVDIDNINRYFNEGPKVFKRPGMALGREVFTCHPPKIEERVRRIIGEFRAGNLDQVPVWMDKDGRTFLVTYYAVRDKQEQYLGTLELVQDMEFAKEHFR